MYRQGRSIDKSAFDHCLTSTLERIVLMQIRTKWVKRGLSYIFVKTKSSKGAYGMKTSIVRGELTLMGDDDSWAFEEIE
ncbi:MAG: hypothetical protein M1820_006322 [Bogoriella megaspora]|nr:MAG: hypothetical protein M1820_006322 [Bogoriella megaspora]